MNKLPKEKRDRLILVILGTILVVAGLYYGVISWQRTSLRELRQKASETAAKADQAERLLNSRVLVLNELEANRKELRDIEELMAPEDNVYAWIVNTIGTFRLSRHSDLAISSFSQPQIAEVQMIPNFPYRGARFLFAGSGDYTQVGAFIADLENSFPYLRLNGLEIEPAAPGTGSTGTEQLSIKIEAVAPVRPRSQ